MRNLKISLLILVALVAIAGLLYALRPLPPPAPADPLVPTVPPRRWPWSPADGAASAAAATRLAASPTVSVAPIPVPSAVVSSVPTTSPTRPAATATSTVVPVTPSLAPVTPRPSLAFTPTAVAAPAVAATPTGAAPTWTVADGSSAWGLPMSLRGRIGVGVPLRGIGSFPWGDATPGWYLNWTIQPRNDGLNGIAFARMIRLKGSDFFPALEQIQATAAAAPASLWLIGNEPDVPWQDNATPEQYAAAYGLLYRAIKQADPTARIAIGGISQPTPLRLAYLDRILAAYRAQYAAEMPVDVWNVHAFILREERNSWGVGIPPGMAVDKGTLYEIDHHADLPTFREQIVTFRRWMAGHGQRNKPLIVTEYGVLMPEDYGFPPELVSSFMTATFDYFLNARDETLGYAADDGRLVQAFCWYSVADTV
ncbi:MAG: glycosyl hydrolase, partial [Anaerolineae bacterium]